MKSRMKSTACFMLVAVIVGLFAFVALAGGPVLKTVSMGTTTGYGAWTNTQDYVGYKLVAIDSYNSLWATSSITVSRIRGTGARTNTVAVLLNSSGTSSQFFTPTNAVYLFKGDVLLFSNSGATGAVADVTAETSP